MKWKQLKTVLILLFTICNLVMTYLIVTRVHSLFYIREDVKRDAAALLSQDGYSVEEKMIPDRLPEDKVWEGSFSENYFEAMLQNWLGERAFSAHATPNGSIRYIVHDTGDLFEYSYPFTLTYARSGEIPDSLPDGDQPLETDRRLQTELMKILDGFLYSGDKGLLADTAGGLRYELEVLSEEGENGLRKVKLRQMEGTTPIIGCEAVALLDHEGVRYLSGTLILSEPSSGYSVSLYDQINILFREKRALLPLGEIPEGKTVSLSGLSSCYCIFWNKMHTQFYLIPAWNMQYSDGTNNIREAIQGEIYS